MLRARCSRSCTDDQFGLGEWTPHGPHRPEQAGAVAPDGLLPGSWGRTQANEYLVRSQLSWVPIDAGSASDGPRRIKRVAESLFGRAPPLSILLTHCHPDPSGVAQYVAQRWRCAVYMHREESPTATGDFAAMQPLAGPLDRWVIRAFMRVIGCARASRQSSRIRASAVGVHDRAGRRFPGPPRWECIPTPGPTPGEPSR